MEQSEHLQFIPMGVELHACTEKVLKVAKGSEMLNFMQISSKTHQAAANLCEKQVVTFVTSV